MKIYKTFTRNKTALMWILSGLSLAMLMIFPAQCRAGAVNGVFLCIQVLIPSLFPFMVLSSYLVCSGLSSKLPDSFGKISEKIFGLPKECLAVILLSIIGGFPVGAKGINTLYKEKIINTKQAEQMAMFCVAPGPGFLVTYAGCSMLGNKAAGYILLVSQILSFTITAVVSKITTKKKTTNNTSEFKKVHFTPNTMVIAVTDAIKSCAIMCALVVIFGAICEIFITLTESLPQFAFITAIIEITNGIKFLSAQNSLVLISAMCGFGGFCVHFQIFAILGNIKISKVKFYIFRVLTALLNTGFTYILLLAFPQAKTVFSTAKTSQPAFNKGISGCIALIICCVVFLSSVKITTLKQSPSR